ncbi:hypothetical protein BC829DRAFT_105121 [Chytridium lagenaria]|nr:hypothetical protein BC829DRAFT_105121 [Chytridium lagenaria]
MVESAVYDKGLEDGELEDGELEDIGADEGALVISKEPLIMPQGVGAPIDTRVEDVVTDSFISSNYGHVDDSVKTQPQPKSKKRKRGKGEATEQSVKKPPQQQQQHRQHEQKPQQPKFEYVCRLCGIPGHHVSACPSPDPDALILPEGYVCKRCNQPGHHIRFCRKTIREVEHKLHLTKKQSGGKDLRKKEDKSGQLNENGIDLLKAALNMEDPAVKNTTLYKIFGDSLPKALSELGNLVVSAATPPSEPGPYDAENGAPRKKKVSKDKQPPQEQKAASVRPISPASTASTSNSAIANEEGDSKPNVSTGAFRQTQRKPIVCRFFKSGQCNRQDCAFSHDLSKELCAFHTILGGCAKGDQCPYSHEQVDDETRNRMLEEHRAFKEKQKNSEPRKSAVVVSTNTTSASEEARSEHPLPAPVPSNTPSWLLQMVNPVIMKEQSRAKTESERKQESSSSSWILPTLSSVASQPSSNRFSSQPNNSTELDEILHLIPGAFGSLRQ